MKVGSLFSGIGGIDLGFKQANHEIAWCVEIKKKSQAVLRKHFPDVKIVSDVKKCNYESLEKVDIITAGFPCQDVSVAGKRAGLIGERSGLFYEAIRIIRELRPIFAVFENVPGLLTSASGLDFASVLSELDKIGSCETAWRIVDSRYFGVAQRRRRVFIVADFRGECASKILFEQEGLRKYIEKSKKRECSITREIEDCIRKSDCSNENQINGLALTSLKLKHISNTITTQVGSETTCMFNGVLQMNHALEVCRSCQEEISSTLEERIGIDGNNVPIVGIRKLTPLECERLQGFPDNWTAEGKDENGNIINISDSCRYAMLGNAVTVNVARWIAEGVNFVIEQTKENYMTCPVVCHEK